MNKIEKDIIESLYLYVEDYSLFSRNDNLVWHFKNFLDQDYSNVSIIYIPNIIIVINVYLRI